MEEITEKVLRQKEREGEIGQEMEGEKVGDRGRKRERERGR